MNSAAWRTVDDRLRSEGGQERHYVVRFAFYYRAACRSGIKVGHKQIGSTIFIADVDRDGYPGDCL